MNDDELESGLRRVLRDPGRRLPDALVPLDAVYAGAQRRRARRGALSAVAGAGVVALVLAGIGTWQVLERRTAPLVGAGASSTTAGPSGDLTQSPAVTPTQRATSVVSPAASSVATPLAVPPGFSAVSVTAISPNHWWVIGSDGLVATTEDGGATFTLTTASPIARNATQVRFASSSVGWVIAGNEANERPTLWQTTDGGMRWSVVGLDGQVVAVEAGGGSAFALATRDDGTTSVWTAPISGRGWHRIGSLGTLLQTPYLAVQAGHAVITGSTSAAFRVWLYPASGTPTSYAAPCTQDVGADDLSATTDSVWLVCVNGMGDSLYRSTDGTAWSPVPTASPVVSRLKVGAIDSTHAAVGTQAKTIRLVRSDSSTVTVARGVPAVVDWTYLAFTNRSDGFALDDSGVLLRTTNGGQSWSRVLFR